jgi:LysR family transcriptional regulator, cell division regulator
MDAADLRVFQSVASTGSMSKAALELNTVQSNVTARIKSLEDEVGFVLFERTNRGVTLTAAGRRLLPFAARAARLLDDAKRAVADQGTPSGTLSIGSLDTTAALHLSPVLAAYVTANPAVDLSMRTGTTRELIEQVLDRQLDGAYVGGPVSHPDLLVEPFVREELVILTAPAVTSFEALSRKPDLKIVVLKAGFGTIEAIIACVSAGVGVTLLPRALLGSVWERGRLRVHPLPNDEGQVETVFIRHRDAFASSALRAFMDMARPALTIAAAE